MPPATGTAIVCVGTGASVAGVDATGVGIAEVDSTLSVADGSASGETTPDCSAPHPARQTRSAAKRQQKASRVLVPVTPSVLGSTIVAPSPTTGSVCPQGAHLQGRTAVSMCGGRGLVNSMASGRSTLSRQPRNTQELAACSTIGSMPLHVWRSPDSAHREIRTPGHDPPIRNVARRYSCIDNEIASSYTRMTGPSQAQFLMARWCSG